MRHMNNVRAYYTLADVRRSAQRVCSRRTQHVGGSALAVPACNAQSVEPRSSVAAARLLALRLKRCGGGNVDNEGWTPAIDAATLAEFEKLAELRQATTRKPFRLLLSHP